MKSNPPVILFESVEEIAEAAGIDLAPGEAEKIKISMRHAMVSPSRRTAPQGQTLLRQFEALSGAAQSRFYAEHRDDLLQFITTPSTR